MAATGTVDFFKYQDDARKKTSVLVFYYILAVILIVLAVYTATCAIFVFAQGQNKSDRPITLVDLWNPELFTIVVGATLLVVAGGSAYKISQLAGGGATVATLLGGRPANPNTRDPDERKILNVVEEMAIASGIPVPAVFILDNEESINAFAAGFSTRDVAIGVTRGCVRLLSRDELQGVIAHEFSHILNGDMRLNIRLIGILHGILVIGVVGYWAMRLASGTGRSRGRDKGKGAIVFFLLGLALMIIGYVGVFFGNLIKSAVSRQREFLADASAVQFTRNPSGIAGALKKIGGLVQGSRLETSNAGQASHLFFSNGLAGAFLSLLDTHPPLGDRIKRLDPSFDGKIAETTTQPDETAAAGFADSASSRVMVPDDVVSSVGAPQMEHLTYASGVVSALPPMLAAAAGEPFSASALVYSLLLNRDEQTRKVQLDVVEKHVGLAIRDETLKLLSVVDGIPREHRLPLAELAVSALKGLSSSQYDAFCDTTVHLVEADEEVDLFEYTLQRMIVRRLDPMFRKTALPVAQYYDIGPLLPHCGKLLSCLAYWGANDQPAAERAFLAATGKLGARLTMKLLSRSQCGLQAVDEALDLLELAAPAIKKRILNACATCIGIDGQVTVEEAELLRVVADALNCPVPPFVPGVQ